MEEEKITNYIKVNRYQTRINEELKNSLSKEVFSDLMEFIESVGFIKWLISPEEIRGFAKDRERDESGKIKVDITKPHILEDMDFFRERALYHEKHGRYTHLRPNPNPKSEYTAFWKEELRRWRDGLVRPSDGEWIPGGYYFYLNYCPIFINEKVKDNRSKSTKSNAQRVRKFPKAWLGDYLFFHYFEQAEDSGAHVKMLKTRGIGAAGPDSEPILTPSGFKTYGDIKIGDYLVDRFGLPTEVTDVFPQGKMDIYEVELMDGRKTRCTLNHNWSVYDKSTKFKNELRTYTLEHIINKGINWTSGKGDTLYKFFIPDIEPIQYDEATLPIGPYALGALLGDGSMSTKVIKIASCDSDCDDFIPKFLDSLGDGFYCAKYSGARINFVIHDKMGCESIMYHGGINPHGKNRLIRAIENLNLRVSTSYKFIPEIYKKSSINQRLELIKGLMDTDGSVNKNGNMEFTNSNERLLDDVAEVLRSLGIQCSKGLGRSARKKIMFGKECNIKQEFRLYIRSNQVLFKLDRKVNRCRDKSIRPTTAITSIKKLDYKENSTCFIVDNAEHIYLTRDFIPTHNSFKLASLSPRNMYVYPGLPNFHLASDKTFLDGEKGVFGKVLDNLDWIAESTPMPKMRLINSIRSREIQLGYQDEYGIKHGLKSSVYGISLKDNPDRARGIRGKLIHYEEDGLFPNLEKAWSVNRKAVEDGDNVFGRMCSLGTGGTSGSNFEGSEKLFRNPLAFNILGIPNVFDKNSNGDSLCGFFWGAYLNRAECYDPVNGEPDVIKALVEIIKNRFVIKYNSSDPSAITQALAEEPITPSEAVMRISGTIFPVSDLKDYRDSVRIQGTRYFDTHYVGDLVLNQHNIEWKPNDDLYPIRRFPLGTDKAEGAIEIFEMPKTDSSGKIDPMRYCGGIDPIDDDQALSTTSLASILIFDLYTDRIVAEYTGRPKFANDFYETCRRMLLFYNATANYESNKKGIFTYFDQKRCLHLLCDTPQILRDMEYVKGTGYGNKAKGTNATLPVNTWGRRLQRDWLMSQAYIQDFDSDGNQIGEKLNMHCVRSIAYIEELIAWNQDINADRISAMGMLMIYREDRLKYIQQRDNKTTDDDYDEYIDKNFANAYQGQNSYHDW